MNALLHDRISLNGRWNLSGWLRHYWRLQTTMEIDSPTLPMIPTVPADVPGSVHGALLQAGVIPDWNDALASYQSEWVNNREWIYDREVTVPEEWAGREVWLACEGLDHSGLIYLDGACVGEFEGALVRHRFRLTDAVKPGLRQKLSVVFHQSPQLDAQMGYACNTRDLKPRFNYTWDWMARVVNVGIWDDVALEATGGARLERALVSADLDADLRTGRLRVVAEAPGAAALRLTLSGPGGAAHWQAEAPLADGRVEADFAVPGVLPWQVNGFGDQPLYTLEARLIDAAGAVSDRREWTLGFRRLVWEPTDGAPEGAYPYLAVVNGRRIFLRGANWVPLSPCYGDVGEAQYRELLQLYRDMNVTMLRIWGGGILEKEACYRIADEMGILLWQEFPLSSAALSNTPPDDEPTIAAMRGLTEDWVERRGHHACHALWDGGNEITYGSHLDREMIPIDDRHPMIAMFKEVVERDDPGKLFLPSSPSGPCFFVKPENIGKGLHHDTHGGWGIVPSGAFYPSTNADDSILRSEVGVPALAHLETLRRHAAGRPILPLDPSCDTYRNHGGFFWRIDPTLQEFGLAVPADEQELESLVGLSHFLQAEQYRVIVEAVRRRAFASSGVLFWMGHDDFSCMMNNSFIELHRALKPAYWALRRAFAPVALSLRYESITQEPGKAMDLRLFAHNDGEPAEASIRVRVRTLGGEVTAAHDARLTLETAGAREVRAITDPAPDAPEGVFAVEMELTRRGAEPWRSVVLFTQQGGEHPLAPLAALPATTLAAEEQGGVVTVTNTGAVAAVGVSLRTVPLAPGTPVGYEVVFPGEQVQLPAPGRAWCVGALNTR